MTSLDYRGRGHQKPQRPISKEQRQEIKEAFDIFDSEKTGKMDYHELKVAIRDMGFEIRKAFELFDEDKRGKIGFRNLKRIARDLGEKLSDDELRGMIDEFDKDQDGEIDEEEFVNIMKQTSLY